MAPRKRKAKTGTKTKTKKRTYHRKPGPKKGYKKRTYHKKPGPKRVALSLLSRSRVNRPKKGHKKKTMSGRGWWDTVKSWGAKALNFAKDNKLISQGLNKLGYSNAGNMAGQLGYGRIRRRRTMRGRGLFGSMVGNLLPF